MPTNYNLQKDRNGITTIEINFIKIKVNFMLSAIKEMEKEKIQTLFKHCEKKDYNLI